MWLRQEADQLPRATKDPATLAAAVKWMSAADLVHLIRKSQQDAEADMQQYGVTVETSRDLRDAAFMPITAVIVLCKPSCLSLD